MTNYITAEQFKNRHGITTTTNQERIDEHIEAASRKVDQITGRQFGPHGVDDEGAPLDASARYFRPMDCNLVFVDDCYEIESVEVDTGDSGTYSTLWTPTDYETDPANGIGPDGQPGWPVTTLRAIEGPTFPVWNRRRAVKVTARWGWEAIPAVVVEATHLLAHRFYYEVSVPGGVSAPNVEFGLPGSPLMRPFTAEGLLKKHCRADHVIGIAG